MIYLALNKLLAKGFFNAASKSYRHSTGFRDFYLKRINLSWYSFWLIIVIFSVVVLRPSQPIMVMSSRSVKLPILSLGKFRNQSCRLVTIALLSEEGKKWRQKVFQYQSPWKLRSRAWLRTHDMDPGSSWSRCLGPSVVQVKTWSDPPVKLLSEMTDRPMRIDKGRIYKSIISLRVVSKLSRRC